MATMQSTGSKLKYDNHKLFMRLACVAATRSRDPGTQVGAVIVRQDGEIVSTGYNGFVQHPMGDDFKHIENDKSFPWDKNRAEPLKNKDYFVVHAEHNAIINACGKDIRGCTIYVTLFPCNECAKLVIHSGISSVIYHDDKDKEAFEAAKLMFSNTTPSSIVCRSYSEVLQEFSPPPSAGSHASSPRKFELEKKRERPDWKQYFMAMAKVVAERSEDPNTKVGAIIVNTNNRVVGIGYNAMPRGCDGTFFTSKWEHNEPKKPNENKEKNEEDAKWIDTKYPYVLHAMQMAMLNRNSADLSGCTLYATLFPDNDCAKSIIQSKIAEVIYLNNSKKDDEMTKASKMMLDWAGIKQSKFGDPIAMKLTLFNETISLVPREEEWDVNFDTRMP